MFRIRNMLRLRTIHNDASKLARLKQRVTPDKEITLK